jgi:hypothetical protein
MSILLWRQKTVTWVQTYHPEFGKAKVHEFTPPVLEDEDKFIYFYKDYLSDKRAFLFSLSLSFCLFVFACASDVRY